MKLSLQQIKTGSKCLRYLELSPEVYHSPEDKDLKVIKQVILKSYRIAMETNWKVTWKKILGWVDSTIYSTVDMENEEQVTVAKREIEHILSILSDWYKLYIEEQVACYVNFPLELAIDRTLLYSTIPLLRVGETPTITIIGKIDRSVRELYNDIEIRGMCLMLAEALEVPAIEVNYLQIRERKMNIIKMYTGKKEHERTRETIKQVASLIELGFNYPSVTEMCFSCPLKGRCKL